MQSLGPTYNDPIPQVLATQFDAGGQKCICFSRRICHRRKIVFVHKARSLFVLDSFTHHITCGLVPRSSILPFMDGKIHKFGYNSEAGDYGNVIITEHEISGKK